ncbi:MAG: MATE family efflux transporter [Clostridia bacterium]|jgi:putative MATE family efflux protein|nr:MATE family efflux transporter [Clostridia bacterium]MBR3129029.1 MATE family efflux transporter [Clostridia bacterium]
MKHAFVSHHHTESARKLTEGKPWKVLVSFAAPIFLSQLFQQLYNTADSWIVGNFLGKEALAAVNSSGSLIFLLISFFVGASMGAGVVISRYFGAGDQERVSRAVHTNAVFSLICGVVLSVFGVIMTPQILHWMGVPDDVLPRSTEYLRYYFLGSVPVVMYNSMKGVMNAVGDSRRPLYYLIVSSLLNIVLDLLFVGAFGFGVKGAAIATVLSQTVSALLCLRQLTRKGTVYQLEWKKLRIDLQSLKEIVKYGLPTGVQNSVIGFANVLVQTHINSFGALAMAACGAYSRIEGFVFLPIMSVSMALTSYIGQNLGAKEYERAKQGARFGILTSITMAEIVGIVLFFFGGFFISTFIQDADPEAVAEIIAIGAKQCRLEALFFFLLAFSHSIAGICRGAGKAIVPMLIMLIVWCVIRIIYITVAMRISHTIELLFAAYPLTWFISSVIYFIYYKKSDWIHGFES